MSNLAYKRTAQRGLRIGLAALWSGGAMAILWQRLEIHDIREYQDRYHDRVKQIMGPRLDPTIFDSLWGTGWSEQPIAPIEPRVSDTVEVILSSSRFLAQLDLDRMGADAWSAAAAVNVREPMPTVTIPIDPSNTSTYFMGDQFQFKDSLVIGRSAFLADDRMADCRSQFAKDSEKFMACLDGSRVKPEYDYYAVSYINALGIPAAKLPDHLDGTAVSRFLMVGIPEKDALGSLGTLFKIPQFKVNFTVGKHSLPVLFYEWEPISSSQAMVINNESSFKRIYDYVAYNQPLVDQLISIFNGRHHDQDPALFKALLLSSLTYELEQLDGTDLWQDQAACRWYHCPYAAAFDQHFTDATVGVSGLWPGGLVKAPAWVWRVASQRYKYELSTQGIGPCQNTAQLSMWAYQQAGIAQAYTDVLEPEWFATVDAVVANQLIPERCIATRVMIYDALAGQLQADLFANPHFRIGANIAPFVADHQQARQLGILTAMDMLWRFPEYYPVLDLIMLQTPPMVDEILRAAYLYDIPVDLHGVVWAHPLTIELKDTGIQISGAHRWTILTEYQAALDGRQ